MTWFLKNKIRKQIKKVQFHSRALDAAVKQYNELVAEYQNMNVFAQIPTTPQEQEQQQQQEQQQEQEMVKEEEPPRPPQPPKKIITKKKKDRKKQKEEDMPDVVEM